MQETMIETTAAPETNPVGRPSLKPTEQQRQLVRELTARGVSQDDIAKQLTISPPTLRKHFRAELDTELHHEPEPTVTQ